MNILSKYNYWCSIRDTNNNFIVLEKKRALCVCVYNINKSQIFTLLPFLNMLKCALLIINREEQKKIQSNFILQFRLRLLYTIDTTTKNINSYFS